MCCAVHYVQTFSRFHFVLLLLSDLAAPERTKTVLSFEDMIKIINMNKMGEMHCLYWLKLEENVSLKALLQCLVTMGREHSTANTQGIVVLDALKELGYEDVDKAMFKWLMVRTRDERMKVQRSLKFK